MIKALYKQNDLRYLFFVGDDKELRLIEEHFNKIPQYMFLPSFRGVPKPEVFFHKSKVKDKLVYWCHSGLYRNILEFCKSNHIELTGIDNGFKYKKMESLENFTQVVLSWNLKYEPRPYQIKAAWTILNYRQSLSQLATRAGKTLIAYMIFRWMIEYEGAKNILMIVPNISLVKQGVNDFKEYQEFFRSETIWADGEFCASSNLTIGTFQSLVRMCDKKYNNKKYDPKFFNKFDVLCVDEAHTLKCQSINIILEQDFLKNIKIKFGFSGSLHKEDTIDSFCEHSLMGPTIQDISTHELQEAGYLRQIKINQVYINNDYDEDLIDTYIKCGEYLCSTYILDDNDNKILLPKEERDFTAIHQKTLPIVLKQAKIQYDKKGYMDVLVNLCKDKGSNLLMLENMVMHHNNKRLDFIYKIINKLNSNIIIFAHNTEYINFLTDHFKSMFPDRLVYKITGSTNIKKREEIIKNLESNNNCILFASYSCVGTGLTFKNIDYGIFAQSFKSDIINKQSLGRGLGLYQNSTPFELYDIIDIFPTKKIFSQGKQKARLFTEQKFELNKIIIK